jgi:hypothetical protein
MPFNDTWESFVHRDEEAERYRERSIRRSLVVDDMPLPLDYADGGEMQCSVCRGICFRHFNDGNRNDIGECCVEKFRRAA